MRTISALIVIVLSVLPALYAGWPGLAPGWFDGGWRGLPLSVIAMAVLMAVFVALAAVCSAAAKGRALPGAGGR